MENYYDATITLNNRIAAYQGDPDVKIDSVKSFKKGDPYNLLSLQICTHSGTHIDAPQHFFKNALSADNIPLDSLIGEVRVVEIRGQSSITEEILKQADLGDCKRVFFKTDHSYLTDRYTRFRTNYVHLDVDACGYLAMKGIKMVGIDSFSIESFSSENFMAHKVLLGAGILIVEMLNLRSIEPGDYQMICLPLKIENSDGAPARVILKEIQ